MTRQECSGIRSLEFSGWIREKLPESKEGFMVSDLDFVLYNYKTKRIGLVEVKTRNKELEKWQNNLFAFLDSCIKNGKPANWIYAGFFSIRFENTFFDDGAVYLNNKLSSEEEIKNKLSLWEKE